MAATVDKKETKDPDWLEATPAVMAYVRAFVEADIKYRKARAAEVAAPKIE